MIVKNVFMSYFAAAILGLQQHLTMSKGGGLKVTELLPIKLTMKEQRREEQGVIYKTKNHQLTVFFD